MPRAPSQFTAVGRRKSAVARVILRAGEGKFVVNDRAMQEYFGRESLRLLLESPLDVTGSKGKFDIEAHLVGGGPSGQADALKHGLARALLAVNTDYRKPLRRAGLLTRDAREVERKKYGRRGARRRPQYSKR
jgi:small subunit ribosomal protein S9